MSAKTLTNFSNDDSENGKNAIALDWQNNNFTRASRVFVHEISFWSLHDYDMKMPIFTLYKGHKHETMNFSISF